VEAAGAVDAQNASTAPWKTTERFSTATTGPIHSFFTQEPELKIKWYKAGDAPVWQGATSENIGNI
jgi:hypothetical protein